MSSQIIEVSIDNMFACSINDHSCKNLCKIAIYNNIDDEIQYVTGHRIGTSPDGSHIFGSHQMIFVPVEEGDGRKLAACSHPECNRRASHALFDGDQVYFAHAIIPKAGARFYVQHDDDKWMANAEKAYTAAITANTAEPVTVQSAARVAVARAVPVARAEPTGHTKVDVGNLLRVILRGRQ